jgi:hypothetical protein
MRNVWQLIGVLLAVGFVGAYWRLIVLTVCAVVGVWLSICAYQGYRAWIAAERRHRQQLVARADEQHGWMLAGDDRGVFGASARGALTACPARSGMRSWTTSTRPSRSSACPSASAASSTRSSRARRTTS